MVTKENDEILWKLFLDDSTHVEEFLEIALSSLSNQIPAYLFQNYDTCFGAENTGRKSQVSRQFFLKS